MNPTYVPPIHNFTKRMYVVLDNTPAWEADVLCDEHWQPLRWNGWLACPLFSRAEAEKIVEHIHKSDNADVVEVSHFVWIHDTLVEYTWDASPFGEGTAKYERTLHRPDSAGRYAIGAWAWVWYEAPVPACRRCGWSQVGWADGDHCPQCHEPFDWAGNV
jgi:hypothetical protein